MGALRIERDGDLLRLTLARPETRNAFDSALITELSEAFVDVGTVRAVVLAGDGPSFCAGADVEWMRASADLDLEANVTDANALRRMFESVDACPAPVIALVQGHAFGGGIGLVACSDIVLAEPRAVFAFSEVKLGIIPAVISPFALRKIGEAAARRYFVTGERFDAATALHIGLVHEVVDDLESASERVLAGSGPPVLAPRVTRSGSSSTGWTARRRRAGSRSAGRARRGKRACTRSSSAAGPRGRRPSRATQSAGQRHLGDPAVRREALHGVAGMQARVAAVPLDQLGLGYIVARVRSYQGRRDLIDELVDARVGVRSHDAPAVPEEQLVLEPMRELHQHVAAHEPLAANRRGDVDAVPLDVDPPRPMIPPDLGRAQKRRAGPARHVERVERDASRLQLGIEAHQPPPRHVSTTTWSWFQSGWK